MHLGLFCLTDPFIQSDLHKSGCEASKHTIDIGTTTNVSAPQSGLLKAIRYEDV